FIHPSIMSKTDWFRANPYDTKAVRVEDYELWQRTVSDSNFKVYTEPLLFYREFGVNYYKKYFKGMNSIIYVINKHNNKETYFIAIRYFIKGVVYRIFNLLGIEHTLISKRNLPLADDIIDNANENLILALDER